MPLKPENVQAYPRPPRLERVDEVLTVVLAGHVIARTANGWRVCETHHAPTYYFPPEDVADGVLSPASGGTSLCEWKGRAAYWDVSAIDTARLRSAWSYPDPTPAFEAIRDHVAFYPGPMDACFVGDVAVTPQPGDFYGGWVTPNLTGTVKGAAGTRGW